LNNGNEIGRGFAPKRTAPDNLSASNDENEIEAADVAPSRTYLLLRNIRVQHWLKRSFGTRQSSPIATASGADFFSRRSTNPATALPDVPSR
jgi:hypothetical protein